MKICLIFLFVVLTIIFSSCQEEEDLDPLWYVDSEIIQDAIDCYGRVVLLEDFSINQLVGDTLNFLDKSIQGSLGYSPDSALVALFFDKNKVLYSTERYKRERKSRTDDFISYMFWTDLSSFRGKVQYSDADPNNTRHIKNNEGDDMWVYALYNNRWSIFRKILVKTKKAEGSFLSAFTLNGNLRLYIEYYVINFILWKIKK